MSVSGENRTMSSFGSAAYSAIDLHYGYALQHLDDTRADRDVEALHQFRVGLRRLRTAITVFEPAIRIDKQGDAGRIGKIMRVLGEVRDHDVMGMELRETIAPMLGSDERRKLGKVLNRLDSGRKEKLAAMHAMFDSALFRKFCETYESWLQAPVYQDMGHLPASEVAPDILLPLLGEFLLHPGWFFGARFDGDTVVIRSQIGHRSIRHLLDNHAKPMHELRKVIKKVRYQAEMFSGMYGPRFRSWILDLKRAQDILGWFQDIDVMRGFLGAHYGEEWERDLPTLEQYVRQERLRVWSEWNTLQTHYFEPANRQTLRLMLVGVDVDTEVRNKNDEGADACASDASNILTLAGGQA